MFKILIIIITISLYGCNITSNTSKVSNIQFLDDQNLSINSTYLAANYFISKGDAYTASEILNANASQLKLLKLKFISNLISGNFEYAENISFFLNNDDKSSPTYDLPKFAIALNKNNLENSLQVAKKINKFLNFENIAHLIEFWLFHLNSKNDLDFIDVSQEISIYKLLILENFYESKKLKKIADKNFQLKNLTNNDLLLLAGYYFRLGDIEKFNTIIYDRLPNQFSKDFLVKKFSTTKNIFNDVPDLKTVVASKIYNNVNVYDLKEYSYSHLKILLEMVLYLCPNMDIAKYSLAELYYDQKSEQIALKKLNSISSQSPFYLASNLKKLSILKSLKLEREYKDLLFKNKNMWPNNFFIMLEFANYNKSNKNYLQAVKVYESIIRNHGDSNRILFLYASSLDKIGKWNEAKELFMKILKKDPKDTYTLNYLAYSLILRNEELDLAESFVKQALSLDPDNGFFLDTLGWLEYQRKNYLSSVFYLEKSVVILPNSSEVMDHLGDCYLMLGRTNEAVYEWKKALRYETDITVINLIKEKLNKYE